MNKAEVKTNMIYERFYQIRCHPTTYQFQPHIFQSVCAQSNLSAPEIVKSMYAKDLISY